MFLDIIHCHVYISKHNVSEIVVYLCLQEKITQLGPIDRASPYLWETETESSLRNVVLKYEQEGVFR
jgi:hypothetical protein